jgi:hypothetical protein
MSIKKPVVVYAARKYDPIKEGAIDGMLEFMENDADFIREPYSGKSAKEIMADLYAHAETWA